MQSKRGLQVVIKRRGGLDRDHLVDMIVRRVLGEIVSTRLANTLCVTVECRATKLDKTTDGLAYYEPVKDSQMKKYRIVIQRDADLTELAKSVAHELRHIEQFARRRLRYGMKNGVTGTFWRAAKGKTIFFPNETFDYWTSPWEVEARATEVLGIKAIATLRAT